MAKYYDQTITVASPVPDGECTSSYFVQYKVDGDAGWTLLNGVGTTFDNPFRVEPLAPLTQYVIRVTRNCCNGQNNYSEISITTPA